MRSRRFFSYVFLIVAAMFAWKTARGADPSMTSGLEGYRVAPGFRAEIVATEPLVVNPVSMTWGPDARLYVIEWRAGREPNDHIKVLTDVDGDGRFDKADMFMQGHDLPAGIVFRDGWTYLTLDHDVVRFRDKDRDGTFEERQVIVSGFGNDDSHHRVSGMIFGPDGWLYLTTGDSDARPRGSDGTSVIVLRSGGVFRCLPDGSKLEVVAHGMRNPWGNVAFDDRFNIFHTDNDNEGSPGFTGCRILHVVEGGDYGWRLRPGARCCNPDFERATWNGGQPGRLGWITETGRGAPAGLTVLNSAAFPASTRNLLIYPDVFRKLVRAYQLEPKGATFGLKREFELLAADDPMFRPDDAEIGPDGALYILDWRTDSGGAGALSGDGVHGRIYRLSWVGTPDEPALPSLSRDRLTRIPSASDAELVEALKSADYSERKAADLELIRRGPKSIGGIPELIKDDAAPETARLHALTVLAAVAPEQAKPIWMSLVSGQSDAALTRLALDQIGRFGSPDDVELAKGCLELARKEIRKGGADSAPAVRALALALGRFHATSPEFQTEVARTLLDLARICKPDDVFATDAVTRSLEKLGGHGLMVIEEELRRPEALQALLGWKQSDGLNAIISAAIGPKPLAAGIRAGMFRALREMVEEVPPAPIVTWLDQNPGNDAEARIEAIRLLKARSDHASEAVAPSLPKLLKDSDANFRREALALAAFVQSSEIKADLISVLGQTDRPIDERRLALVALRAYSDVDPSLAKSLVEMVNSRIGQDNAFRSELLQAIASLDFASVVKPAESSLTSKDRDLRQTAIQVLGQRPATALTVAKLFNEGKLPPEDLRTIVEALSPHRSPELQEALQTLLKRTVLAAPTGVEARRMRDFVRRSGSSERGKAIFFDAKKGGCASCHRLEGVGEAIGPDLTRIWDTLSFEKRIESILDPSKEIKEGYISYKVATTDGQVLTGLLLSDTAEAVTLKDAKGREIRIQAKNIEEKGADKTSLMPVGVVGSLSLNEFADLLAFLGDRKAQEGIRARKP